MCEEATDTVVKRDTPQNGKSLVSRSPEETERIGEQFSGAVKPGDVVALFGDLASGKTTFVRGVCRGLNVGSEVTSPTFTFIHEYCGAVPVYHFDFYRLEDAAEVWQFGCDEYFYGDGICLIEWADRIQDHLPQKRVEIYFENRFEDGTQTRREISIRRR